MVPLWEQDAYWVLLLALLVVSLFSVWFFSPNFRENSTPRLTIESAGKPRLSGVTTTTGSRQISPASFQVTWALTAVPMKSRPPWDDSLTGAQSPIMLESGQQLGHHRRPILVLRAWKTIWTNCMLMLLVLKTKLKQSITTYSKT